MAERLEGNTEQFAQGVSTNLVVNVQEFNPWDFLLYL